MTRIASPLPTDTTAATAPDARRRGQPMSPAAPVWLQPSACLRLRSQLAVCSACVQACPVYALQAGPQSLELRADACVGCGRCQAVCPAGALEVDGFDHPAGPATRDGERAIECSRTAGEGAWSVPCLGGLSEGQLLSLCAEAPEVPLVLVDRGDCADCVAGRRETPLPATLHRVSMWLADAGVPASLRPRLEARAPQRARRSRSEAMQPTAHSRRAFFGALARPAAAPTDPCRPARSAASSERQRVLAALRTLSAHHGGRMPAALFHRLELNPCCQGHRACASACPTGALVRWRDDGVQRMGVAFDAAACIGCGHCVSLCPEQAIELRPGAGSADAPRQPLSAFVQRECSGCGARFAARGADAETRCDRCRKSAGLARSAFQTLFGTRP